MRISVALATYQGARFLEQQLDSIAGQSTPPDELVVSDDGSTDGTATIVNAFAARVPFPVPRHVNEVRLGPARNFEVAIRHCRGDVTVLADQDDVWLPHKLARIAEAFGDAPRPGLAFSDCELIDEDSRLLGTTGWATVGPGRRELRAIERDHAFRTFVARQHRAGGTVTGATMAFRTDLLGLALPFPEAIALSGKGLLHDSWITLVASSVTPVTVIREPLVRHRQHPEQEIGMRGTTHHGLPGRPGGREASREWMYALRVRLAQARGGGPRRDASIAVLDAWLRHFDARDALPRGHLRRVPGIARELLTGRYHAYSSGVRSAGRDLMG